MTNVTKPSMIEAKLRSIKERTGFELKVNEWSPGDGMTRYQLMANGNSIGRIFIGRGNFYDIVVGGKGCWLGSNTTRIVSYVPRILEEQ